MFHEHLTVYTFFIYMTIRKQKNKMACDDTYSLSFYLLCMYNGKKVFAFSDFNKNTAIVDISS